MQGFRDSVEPGGVGDGAAAAFLIGLNDGSELLASGDIPEDPLGFVLDLVGATIGAAEEVASLGVETVLP